MDSLTGSDDLDALYQQYATHIRPLITRVGDQRWRAQYPGVDWHVIADSEQAAGDDIATEALRRFDAGEPDAQPPHDLLRRHLQQPVVRTRRTTTSPSTPDTTPCDTTPSPHPAPGWGDGYLH